MTQKEFSALTDEEVMAIKKKVKKTKIINAVLIGFLAGIIIWSVAKNTWGVVSLIPLFFIYKLVNRSKVDKELEELIKTRNLD
ncbi:MAG: FUSC family protein [Flavobacteriaceae bacterium]